MNMAETTVIDGYAVQLSYRPHAIDGNGHGPLGRDNKLPLGHSQLRGMC